jgi:predicted AAA+ superfamily ATPase
MVGRYFPYRLYPFSVSESATPPGPDELEVRPVNYPLKDLIKLSGFPEPLMGGAKDRAERWSRLRLERIMMQDVRDLRAIHQFKQMELMIDLLPTRIGSPFSLNAVREDLEIAYATGREWFEVLNNLYIIFSIPPYSKNIARSLKREPKIYLFDPLTITDPGAALENTIALHLLKACHFWTDTAQGFFQLHYLRNKEKQEVDFCITRDKKVWMLVECKSSDTQISPALQKFTELLKPHWSIQTVEKKNYDHLNSTSGIRVMDTERFLSMLV